jgi:hypothetical protein
MSAGIIYAMLVKLRNWRNLITIFFVLVVAPIWISCVCPGQVLETLEPMIIGSPVVTILMSYLLVKDASGNTRSLSDGEYLSLVFTRPVTRASYLLTKLVACSVMVSVLTMLQLAIFCQSEMFFGRSIIAYINGYTAADILLNSISISALMILISAFPPKVGLIVFMLLLYLTMLGATLPQMSFLPGHSDGLGFYTAISGVCGFIRTCLTPTFSTGDFLNTTSFSWLPLITYVSNVAIYLVSAIYVLSKREFFYASN